MLLIILGILALIICRGSMVADNLNDGVCD